MSLQSAKLVLVMVLVLAAVACLGQNQPSALMHTKGDVTVNGTDVRYSMAVFQNDKIITKPTTSASVTFEGTAIVLAPSTEFTALRNAFVLDSGGSKIVTSTGVMAKVKAYDVFPKDPTIKTVFELNWSGQQVWVYARTGDLNIHGPCDDWRVKQGETAVIENPYRCKPGVWFYDPNGNLKIAAAVAGTAGAAIAGALIPAPQNLSAEAP